MISTKEMSKHPSEDQRTKESEANLRAIFENSTEGFVITDTHGVIKIFNEQAKKSICLNLNIKHVQTGNSIFDYIEPARIKSFKAMFVRIIKGENIRYDRSYPAPDGGLNWFHYSISPVRDQNKITGICITGSDITSRKRTEEKVQASELRFRSLIENSHDILTIFSDAGAIEYMSPAARRTFGFTSDELLPENISCLVHADETDVLRDLLNYAVTHPGVSFTRTIKIRKKDDTLLWAEGTISNMLHVEGLNALVANFRDVTEKMQTEEALRNSEQLYKSLFNNSPLPTIVYRKSDLLFLEVNEKTIVQYGYTKDELLTMTAFDLHTEGGNEELHRLISTGKIGIPGNKIIRHKKKNGEVCFVNVSVHDIVYKGESAFLAIIHDITEELALRKLATEQKNLRRREITKATIDGQERQSAVIGTELHDNVNQMLACAKLYLQGYLHQPEDGPELIEKTIGTLNRSIEEIRRLSRSLIPTSLGDLGLVETIKELVKTIEPFVSPIIYTEFNGVNERLLSDGLQMSVYRILQEQLNNIDKYAEASVIIIKLDQDKDALNIIIADNGKGFDVERKRNGIGITNMINRAETFNGSLKIMSSPGKGTTIEARFKLS